MASDLSTADATELARLRSECRRLQQQVDTQTAEINLLRARFARYETALRGSQVTVYTQDLGLRFTSVSNPVFGKTVDQILGRTDAEVLPSEGARLHALKQTVLETGEPGRIEIALQAPDGTRWQDLHVEPLRSEAGDIVGVTCAAIDITERKDAEAHLRLLLRELTHRSKNLLAVIQAMARQTARHAGSITAFLDQFGARVQGLAASHDLLVREGWHGASLRELMGSQLAGYSERGGGRVDMSGPDIAIKPEAAQNLGLAFHELLVNAAKFGSLSWPEGRVSIAWDRRAEDAAVVLDWVERDGPKVKPRRKQGFGSMVIERNLVRALEADVSMDFDPDGLRCRIVVPARQTLPVR